LHTLRNGTELKFASAELLR